jgi:murein DD-endopeptidase MepM/ murein hydrolase activator NlpD
MSLVMISLVLAAVIYTANQGSAVQLKVPNEPGLKCVHVIWQKKNVPAFQVGEMWTTIVGVDLDTEPGEHRAEALLRMDDGSVDRRDITVNVLARKFRTTRLKVDQRFIHLSKADVNRANREAKETDAIYRRMTTDLVPNEAFTVPIPGGIGANFGERRVFNGEPRAPHSGADLRATTGTPVHATNRGRVVLATKLFFTGNTVILDHGLGIYSLYAHLSRMNVKRGDIVKNGQTLGLAGATGRVTAPHLHWGMRVQGARVDPFSLIGPGFTLP